ncbi:GGDEF domain-containing protein [Fibrobacter sp. UBA4297]|uniref:GGDEF domain-containing protein n=1 Tax=Fibrobacter sp. UBA4297 TaxID=1946536 RepID=UPI0025C6AFBE|nr:GGDEF domain-containing protein [Fibrobacter sp. UBA4297]
MKNQKKPIHRSLILGSAVFITFMCLLLSIQAYLTYSQSLYKRYDDKLSNILNYAVNRIDMDDLYQNAITGQKTEKYNDVQQLLNGMVDDFELFYLYSLFVRNDSIYNICSATSKAERERGEEDMKLLELTDAYELSEIRKFAKAMTKDEISFFEEDSDWGAAYTACKPYVNSLGVHFGVICADISISDLHKTVNNYVMYNVLLTLGLGLLFALILFIWLRRNVTGPILELEKSARHFAEKSRGKKTPDELIFAAPDIHTHNEIESLSNAISQMSKDMRTYVQGLLEAEAIARSAKEQAEDMTNLAFTDSLTHVNSKVAYDKTKEALQEQIANNTATFAIVMIDVNNLKDVNDNFGHDCGDKYILGACRIFCNIYRQSPVYRVGGDEFVVILQNSDYKNREKLLKNIEREFQKTANNTKRKPYERYSVAYGMSEFKAGDNVDDVFKRADESMYAKKEELKGRQKKNA